jgi:hypothetical protein
MFGLAGPKPGRRNPPDGGERGDVLWWRQESSSAAAVAAEKEAGHQRDQVRRRSSINLKLDLDQAGLQS